MQGVVIGQGIFNFARRDQRGCLELARDRDQCCSRATVSCSWAMRTRQPEDETWTIIICWGGRARALPRSKIDTTIIKTAKAPGRGRQRSAASASSCGRLRITTAQAASYSWAAWCRLGGPETDTGSATGANQQRSPPPASSPRSDWLSSTQAENGSAGASRPVGQPNLAVGGLVCPAIVTSRLGSLTNSQRHLDWACLKVPFFAFVALLLCSFRTKAGEGLCWSSFNILEVSTFDSSKEREIHHQAPPLSPTVFFFGRFLSSSPSLHFTSRLFRRTSLTTKLP